MPHKLEFKAGKQTISLESGEIARQADGSVIVQCGGTVVLVTAVVSKNPREGIDFLPLTVDYIEKHYAAGKIPGGFFKREGRPGEKETLTSRLIDRSLRPLFPDNFCNETQVIALVLSADQENDPAILALNGASVALTISPIPFLGPIGGVRVGEIDGEFVINPTNAEIPKSSLNLLVAGTAEAIVMVEGQADNLSEDKMLGAILYAHDSIKEIIQKQKELQSLCGKEKMEVAATGETLSEELEAQIKQAIIEDIKSALVISEKLKRQSQLTEIKDRAIAEFAADDEEKRALVSKFIGKITKNQVRDLIASQGLRPDGRSCDQIRQITSRVGVLPRTHGSALFTRGETQALAITTLGTASDEQKIDNLDGEFYKSFMLHYNFPPFSVGEVKFLRSPGRREIGHGSLAEKAIKPVLPQGESFPYTIRIVSDILESNGSSSMATVCGASMSLMDAGVPIKEPVAGIAMGLIKQGDKFAILSDIAGIEDHCGDMDFKVAGTRQGINAIQMDIKITGITKEVLEKALEQARVGRLFILDKMAEVLSASRDSVSTFAPRIYTIQVKPSKVREIIGPGGKVIKGIIEKTGVEIDIKDDGKVTVASPDEKSAEAAIAIIEKLIEEAVVNKVYLGKVKRIADFGAFVEIIPNTDGLLHISQIANYRVERVEDELSVGDEIEVKVIEMDGNGRIRLSRKVLLPKK